MSGKIIKQVVNINLRIVTVFLAGHAVLGRLYDMLWCVEPVIFGR
jgi:hypothetical protein